MSSPQIQIESSSAIATPQQFLKQGIGQYEAEQFTDAMTHWQQALSLYEDASDWPHQVLVWMYLALGYQQLGDGDLAQEAIATSLTLLRDGEASQSLPLASDDTTILTLQTKVFNTVGHLQWSQGKYDEAIATWEQALSAYQELADDLGVWVVQFNQSKALRATGRNAQAIHLLDEIQDQLADSTSPEIKARVSLEMGITLRRLGYLDRALTVLQESVETAPSSIAQGTARLELAHVQAALSGQSATLGSQDLAQQYAEEAIASYTDIINRQPLPSRLTLFAKLSRLQFWIHQEHLLPAMAERYQAIPLSWPELVQEVEQLPPSRATVFSQINLGHSLMCLKRPDVGLGLGCQQGDGAIAAQSSDPVAVSVPWHVIDQLTLHTLSIAQTLQDPIAESYALGQLGTLRELIGHWSEAKELTEQAIARLGTRNLPDIGYRWTWQLARLLEKQGDRPQALAAYVQTVEHIESIRSDLLQANPDLQFSFRDRVEPVYRALVNLRLEPERLSQQPIAQTELNQVIQDMDSLQLMELRNFLGCDLPELIRLDKTARDPHTAIVYPIVLADRIAVILEQPDQTLSYQQVSVAQSDVDKTLKDLRFFLTEPGMTPEVLDAAAQVYQWIISPIEAELQGLPDVQNLVFVLDGAFRNIPMGVLYDGDRYLIEKGYAIALAPRLDLFRPEASDQPLNILAGGVDISQTIGNNRFPEIERLEEELSQIPASLTRREPLVNEAFTKENIERLLQTGDFSAIHWKTHGVFSSNPAETYLVAYQDSIKANELGNLVQTVRHSQVAPLELLVLSACETAQGDSRAVLGLAGVAVQAGAKSTVSTLWRADDEANTRLMARFYDELSAETTKAEALRQAQLSLINEVGYPAPYYWATYTLVGNWL